MSPFLSWKFREAGDQRSITASSSDHLSEAKSKIDLTHSATLISGKRNNLRTSRSPSCLSAPLRPAPGDGPELQKREKKRKHQDPDDETSSDSQHSAHGKHGHNSCDVTDDEDPRPAKRRKPRLETSTAPAIYLGHSVEPRIGQPRTLATSSAVRPQLDDMQVETESRCPSTALDNSYQSVLRTSRSLSAVREPGLVAKYQERFVQGVLKCTMVGCETAFDLEFWLPDISGPLDLPINPLGVTFNSDHLAHTTRVLGRYTTSQVPQGKTTTAAAHKTNRDNDRDVCSGGDSNDSEQQTSNVGRHAQWSAKASLGTGSSASSQAGLRVQYFTDINWPVGPLNVHPTTSEWQIEEIPWTVEEDMMVVQLKEEGHTWAEIHEVMLHRSEREIKRHYFKKLKRKREETLQR
ncbi:hypothetical protein F5884DRAFT_862662 [Xylogone sp. PMI_703]|nr:hypothetical protein F5884DRAFT_862662 [Xylogone sp. PMI_703]